MALPGLIGERVFTLFDYDKDGFLNKKEFEDGLSRLFGDYFEDNLEFVFDLFDFNHDGNVSKEDMRMLLSHVPLAHLLEVSGPSSPREKRCINPKSNAYIYNNYSSFFVDRLESQEELVKVIEKFMKDEKTITFKGFADRTNTVSSTIFLCVLKFSNLLDVFAISS